MNAPLQAYPLTATTDLPVPLRRFVLAWAVMYFMVQCLGVAIENTRRMRRLLRGRVWLARAWTFAVVFLPVGLFLHPGLVDRYLVPTLVARGVPGLERSLK